MSNDHLRLEFASVDDEAFLIPFAQLLGIPFPQPIDSSNYNDDNTCVRKELDTGLSMLCFDFQLNNPVVFAKKMNLMQDKGRSFSINYLASTSEILLKCPLLNRKFELNGGLNILILPDDMDIEFTVRPRVAVKVMTLTIQPDWMRKEFGGIQLGFTNFLEKFLTAQQPPFIIESSTTDELRIVSDLLKHAREIPVGMLNLKPRVMTLVADLFSRISEKPNSGIIESRLMYFQKMQEVEDILRRHVEDVLPDIEKIARMVALSVSTLKRHFKVIYRKSIYDFYLELKMEHAKRLLLDNYISVNEVAFKLQYEKASSFIDMFKKHQGYSPGVLRKKLTLSAG